MRNGSIVYICHRISDEDDEVQEFGKPEAFVLRPMYLTIQPNAGNVYQRTFGEFKDYTHQMCGSPYQLWEKKIAEGDRVYLDSIPDGFKSKTEPDEGWGYDANYKIVKVAKQNKCIYYALQSMLER